MAIGWHLGAGREFRIGAAVQSRRVGHGTIRLHTVERGDDSNLDRVSRVTICMVMHLRGGAIEGESLDAEENMS